MSQEILIEGSNPQMYMNLICMKLSNRESNSVLEDLFPNHESNVIIINLRYNQQKYNIILSKNKRQHDIS